MSAGEWWKRGECRETPVAIFFPEGRGPRIYDTARKICSECPVVSECLEAALEEENGKTLSLRHGMRGGLTAEQRIRFERERAELAEMGNELLDETPEEAA